MTEKLDRTTTYTVAADAMESRLGDETVILHRGSGTYFGLDAVGSIVWESLQQGNTVGNVCADVRASFPDAPDSAEADVVAFMQELLDNQLIEQLT